MVVFPLREIAPVPVVNVFAPAMTTLPLSVFVAVDVLNWPVAEEKSKAPDPAAAVKLIPAAREVFPLNVTAPVPVEKVLEPAITTLPLNVFVSELVENVPVEESANAPEV